MDTTEEAELHQGVRHAYYQGQRMSALSDDVVLALDPHTNEITGTADNNDNDTMTAEALALSLMHGKLPLRHLEPNLSPAVLAAVAHQRLRWTGQHQCVCVHGESVEVKRRTAAAVVAHLVAARGAPAGAVAVAAKVAAAQRLLAAFITPASSAATTTRCGYVTSVHYDQVPSAAAVDVHMASALPVSYPYYDCREQPFPAVDVQLRAVEIALLACEGSSRDHGVAWGVLEALETECRVLQHAGTATPLPHPASDTAAWVARTIHKAVIALSTANIGPVTATAPCEQPAFTSLLVAMDTVGLPRATADDVVRALTAVRLLGHLARHLRQPHAQPHPPADAGPRETLMWAAAAGCLGTAPDVLRYCFERGPVAVGRGVAERARAEGPGRGLVVVCTSSGDGPVSPAARAAALDAFAAQLYQRVVSAVLRAIDQALVFTPEGDGGGVSEAPLTLRVIEAPTLRPCDEASPGGWADLAANYVAERLRATLLAPRQDEKDEKGHDDVATEETAELLRLCTSLTCASPCYRRLLPSLILTLFPHRSRGPDGGPPPYPRPPHAYHHHQYAHHAHHALRRTLHHPPLHWARRVRPCPRPPRPRIGRGGDEPAAAAAAGTAGQCVCTGASNVRHG